MSNMRVMRKGLLPCSHCGGRAGVYEDYTGWWQVQCDKCGALTLKRKNPEECVEAWNRRKNMRICINCDGTGYVAVTKDGRHTRCPVCKGRGVIFEEDSKIPKDFAGVDLSKEVRAAVTRMSRRDKMRAMTDEQLAEYLVESAEELTAPDGDYHKHAERFALGWLQQEVEE